MSACTPNVPAGGLFVVRPEPRLYEPGDEFGHLLVSDWHLGSSACDEQLLRNDLDDAVARGDRVLVLGDLMDLILAKDKKRFAPSCLASWLRGRDDIVNASVERACELLRPAAERGLLDLVAGGNHDLTGPEHRTSVDPVRLVTDALAPAAYAGYAGYLRYQYLPKGEARSRDSLTLFYWHGSGGGSSVSTAANELEKKGFVEGVDVFWVAHRHVRLAYETERLGLDQGGKLFCKSRWNVRTGGYLRPYAAQSPSSVKGTGRQSNYAADSLLPSYAPGGCRLVATMGRRGVDSVRVEYTTRR